MEGNIFETKQRLPWIDVSKGILILFVVLGHIEYYAQEFVGSHSYDILHHIMFLYLPYYIPAFFVVTGYCSNFSIPFHEFLLKNVKTLLIPSVLIGTFVSRWLSLFLYEEEGLTLLNFLTVDYKGICMTGGHWFLTSLFLSKMVLYFQQKYYKEKSFWTFVILLIIMLLGSILYNRNIFPNIWYYKHTMILLPFLFIGTWLRKNPQWIDKSYNKFAGFGIIIVAFFMQRFGMPYPYIVGAIGVFWGNFLLCVIMVVFGSLMIFSLSKKMQKFRLLEILGKHSLMIFLLHSSFLIFFLRLAKFWEIGSYQNLWINIVVIILIWLSSTICPVFIDLWIDKHAGFLKGKL